MKNPVRAVIVALDRAPPVPLVHLADHADLADVQARIAKLVERRAVATSRRNRAKRTTREIVTKPREAEATVIKRAERLARGGIIPSADPAAEYGAAGEEEIILGRAIAALTEEKREVESRLSFEASEAFAAQNRAAMIRLDDACGRLFEALKALQDIDLGLRVAGYSPCPSTLPTCVPVQAYQLGDPNRVGSPASMLRAFVSKTFGVA